MIKLKTIFNKITAIGGFFKKSFLNCQQYCQILFKSLSKIEKTIISILIIVIIGSIIIINKNNYLNTTQLVPADGGIYREAVLAKSSEEIESVINKLTNTALVRFDQKGKIISDMASSWEISEDQKTYTFHLNEDINSEEIANIIKEKKEEWTGIEIQTPDLHTIIFILSQPFAPFLASLTDPIFPYGPYIKKEELKDTVVFSANEDFSFKKPYIETIELQFFSSQDKILSAAKKDDIQGIGQLTDQNGIPDDWHIHNIELPRYIMLFFNLRREVLDDKELRQKLAKSENIGKEINLTLITSEKEEYYTVAQQIKEDWQKLGVNVEITLLSTKELQQEIIPNRNFDLLLYGLDYSFDPDPYPFWHSSQATDKGYNLSSFADVDADKLLEQARQTNNEEERQAKYQEFNKIFDDERPAIVIKKVDWQFGTSDKIKGIIDHQGITGADRYFEVWNWYIKEQRVKK